LALGTQTVGSVIRPAAYCGVTGFKPTLGRLPTAGIIYFSRTLDQVGLFTQDAAGMSLATSALLEGWQPTTHAGQAGPMPVLGVPEGPYLAQTEPEGLRSFEGQLARLEEAGCQVRRVPALDDVEEIAKRHMDLVSSEFAKAHDAWFRQYGPLYGPHTAELIEQGRAISLSDLEIARGSPSALRGRLHESMDREGLDVWASPPAPGPAPQGLGSTGSAAMNLPWTHAGLPAITLPAGRAENGLPFGLQLTARFGADESLLGWAEALEPVLAD
jgi:Asp-tRNA(Asn)/Glu-tRNA(Gln) amidotransferase A subunit family amidase